MDLLDSGAMMTLNEEKIKLEQQLAGVSGIEKRYKEVCTLLGEGGSDEKKQVKAEAHMEEQEENGGKERV